MFPSKICYQDWSAASRSKTLKSFLTLGQNLIFSSLLLWRTLEAGPAGFAEPRLGARWRHGAGHAARFDQGRPRPDPVAAFMDGDSTAIALDDLVGVGARVAQAAAADLWQDAQTLWNKIWRAAFRGEIHHNA